MSFALHPKLAHDSDFVCDLPLSQVRLMNNAAFPWILLIPRQPNLIEIIDLSIPSQEQLLREIRMASIIMKQHHIPKKLNIANLGNIVKQLHIHIIARFESDQAWPNPVWNNLATADYLPELKKNYLQTLAQDLQDLL